jgi:excisionase family DNA binding protein
MALLGMSRPTIYLLLENGLPSYKVGKRRVFDEDEVIEWVKDKRNGTLKEKEGEMKMTLEEYKRLGKEAFQEAFKIRPSFLKATRTLEAYFTGKETDTAKAKAAFEVLKKYASLREKGMRTIKEKLESIMPLQRKSPSPPAKMKPSGCDNRKLIRRRG